MILLAVLFSLAVFAVVGTLQIHAVWQRRSRQREEIERLTKKEFEDAGSV